MKPVAQLERTGCGIASVAAIVGLSYGRTKAIADSLGVRAQDERLWSETLHVRRLLRHLKWHIDRGRPCWHWVVFVRDDAGARVLDSNKGLQRNARTHFGRIKPKWFIPVISA